MDSIDHPPSIILLFSMTGRRAESMESLLSLSDVEFGMEEHAGDMDEIDYHRKKIKRRVSWLKYRTTGISRSKILMDGPSTNIFWLTFRGLICPTYCNYAR